MVAVGLLHRFFAGRLIKLKLYVDAKRLRFMGRKSFGGKPEGVRHKIDIQLGQAKSLAAQPRSDVANVLTVCS